LSRTVRAVGPGDAAPAAAPAPTAATARTAQSSGGTTTAVAPEQEIQLPKVTIKRDTPKVGRNDPCPCGSGKKFKHCHGA